MGRNSRVKTFTLDFLAVDPAQALSNSTPQLLARERRAVAQGAQLGPGDLRMNVAAQAALGRKKCTLQPRGRPRKVVTSENGRAPFFLASALDIIVSNANTFAAYLS
jgi:hypothetical protein